MNKSEISIFKNLINRRTKGFSTTRSNLELNKSSEIQCFGEVLLSFDDSNSFGDIHYVGIDPRSAGGSGNKLFFLTQWNYIHKPLTERIYYPSQNVDSKFKSGFGCSFLGVLKSLSLYAHIGNSGLLRLDFENGPMNLIIRDQYIAINMDKTKTLENIQEDCFDSEKGTELLII